MKTNSYIDLSDIVFNGSILDIGFDNYGIIYNVFKSNNKDIEVEYFSGKNLDQNINKNSYDNCCLFFSLYKFRSAKNKSKLLNEIYDFLKEDGLIYIWDVYEKDKRFSDIDIKIKLSNINFKKINIKKLNISRKNDMEKTIQLLSSKFKILDNKNRDGVYYIKAQKINNIKEPKLGEIL